MEVVQKKSVWNFTLFLIYIHLARCQVQLTHNTASASSDTFICGTNTNFTCKIDSAPTIMSWTKDGSSLTDCPGATDACADATVDNYQFTSDVAVNEFYLTVNPVMFSNAGTFTCSIGASVDDSKTISIAAVPTAISMTQESGTGTITLQATTDCGFPKADVSIKWYYLEELTDTPQLYTDNGFSPVRTEDSSTCTSGNCTSGVGVSKVVSTVTFNEKGSGSTSAYLQAKMVHKAASSSSPSVVATTTNKYIIIEATTVTDAPTPGELELWKYILIAIGATIGFLFLIGIILGIIIICPICCSESFLNQDGCDNCVDNSYCSCKCCASTPCGACCNIEELPFWYKVLWASIICIPIALGILLIWKCCGQTNDPHRNDSRNNSSGDVPLNTKYSN